MLPYQKARTQYFFGLNLLADRAPWMYKEVASLKRAATEEGYEVFLAENGKEALTLVEETPLDLVLLDMKLPDLNGIDVLKKIKEFNEALLVIIITGYSSVESAVKAIKLGAYDYIKKPFKADSIKLILKLALDKLKLNREVQRFLRSERREYGFENIIGQSPKIREVFHLLKKIVCYDAPTVLIRGESGTGKELIARAIHNMSQRASGAFIEIDCATMPTALLESEMFGYEKMRFCWPSTLLQDSIKHTEKMLKVFPRRQNPS